MKEATSYKREFNTRRSDDQMKFTRDSNYNATLFDDSMVMSSTILDYATRSLQNQAGGVNRTPQNHAQFIPLLMLVSRMPSIMNHCMCDSAAISTLAVCSQITLTVFAPAVQNHQHVLATPWESIARSHILI